MGGKFERSMSEGGRMGRVYWWVEVIELTGIEARMLDVLVATGERMTVEEVGVYLCYGERESDVRDGLYELRKDGVVKRGFRGWGRPGCRVVWEVREGFR